MSPALLARPAADPTPWTVEGMRALYRQSKWTKFYENCKRDRLLFADLVNLGMGSFDVVVIEGRPVARFEMSPSWVRGLELELATERAAQGVA